jgi:asparagine synthase (glutamine-hydrolysing)
MQPFHLYDDHGRVRLSMVFNGEIYNFRELRRELEGLRPGYAWRTTGDTEVLLVAYDVWREKAVERLNGMFAVAIWDEGEGSLYLARDRMGQKPLYVAVAPGRGAIAFASELGAFRALPWMSREIGEAALADYLKWGYLTAPMSIYVGAAQLPPGAFATSDDPTTYVTYFDANGGNGAKISDAEAVTRTRDLVVQAVIRQLVSDVPLGCFLSGGIDSSVVTAAMARAAGDPRQVHTFSIGFEDARYDETRYSEAVARHLGTTHRSFVVRPDAAADLPKLAAVYGEPFGDSSALPTHYLSRETRRHVKVALSGDGGDELFGGYGRYRAMQFEATLRRIPRPLRALMAGPVTEQLPPGHPKSVRSKMHRFLKTLDLPAAERYASYLRLFDLRTVGDLMGKEVAASDDAVMSEIRRWIEQLGPVRGALAADRVTYLPGDLLTKVDRASMLHNLEVRSPFMDPDLVRFAAGLTTEQLLKGGPKRMLREAFAGELPEFVFRRRKMGFAVPIGEWFRSSLRGMLHDHLFAADSFAAGHFNVDVVRRLVREHEEERVDHSQRLYALLMLELWWRLQK